MMGQDEDIIGYQLVGKQILPIRRHKRGMITTMAFILCAQCSKTISTIGGPRYNALCSWECIREFLKE